MIKVTLVVTVLVVILAMVAEGRDPDCNPIRICNGLLALPMPDDCYFASDTCNGRNMFGYYLCGAFRKNCGGTRVCQDPNQRKVCSRIIRCNGIGLVEQPIYSEPPCCDCGDVPVA